MTILVSAGDVVPPGTPEWCGILDSLGYPVTWLDADS
jgi:hypothetical protein